METKTNAASDVLHSSNHSKLSPEEIAKAMLGTIDIILALKRQSLPGSRKPVLRSDCRLRRMSPIPHRAMCS
jgi:hypothetical protein